MVTPPEEVAITAYFERVDASSFRTSPLVAGAWSVHEQHVAPPMGLLAHELVRDRDARGRSDLLVGRLSYDILGTLPLEPVETRVEVLRPGRTVELVEAVLSHAGRPALRLRAWLQRPGHTAAVAGSPLEPVPGPDEVDPWDPTSVWPGAFIGTIEVRRAQVEPGRAVTWLRTPVPLVAGEDVGPLARTAGLLDVANGMTVRAAPADVAFPNLDLTAHLLREPAGGWVGLDTSVTFGDQGVGVTSSVLHDERGLLGVLAQGLTVRPR